MLTLRWSDRNLKDLAPHGKYLEWITNLKVQKHALDGTFFVHVFLGEFNRENPLAWRSDPNLVGTFSVLGESVGTGCKKCKKDREDQLQVTGQVPLTLALAERYLSGQIENLTPEKVVPYLQTNLHWRVAAVSVLSSLPWLCWVTLPIAFCIWMSIGTNSDFSESILFVETLTDQISLTRLAALNGHVEKFPIWSCL